MKPRSQPRRILSFEQLIEIGCAGFALVALLLLIGFICALVHFWPMLSKLWAMATQYQ